MNQVNLKIRSNAKLILIQLISVFLWMFKEVKHKDAHLSLENSQRGSSGRSYSGMGSSWAELRRVVILTNGVLELMEELESDDTCEGKDGWLITWVLKTAPNTINTYMCGCDCVHLAN